MTSLITSQFLQHYLRGEPGIFHDDLYPLVSCLPKYSFPSAVGETDRSAVLGIWRTQVDGSTYLPFDSQPGRPPIVRASTFPSIPRDFYSTSANDEDVEKYAEGRHTIKLAPGHAPHPHTVYGENFQFAMSFYRDLCF